MSRVLALAGCLLFVACNGSSESTLVVVQANLAHRPAAGLVTTLKVLVEDTEHSATRDFSRRDGKPLTFPTSFGIELGPSIAGPLRIDVRALDQFETALAGAAQEALVVRPGKTTRTDLWLDCIGACPVDSGQSPDSASTSDAAALETVATCGNGHVDPGETCDIAITVGQTGACPPADCDDNIPCTVDMRIGTGCQRECAYVEIRRFASGDGCCPANGTPVSDSDCSLSCGNRKIEAGETCDTAIPFGEFGACPTGADCNDREVCTNDILISANTCSARCLHMPITSFTPGDGCCPADATYSTDSDCPMVCHLTGDAAFCASRCDNPNVTACVAGDGCCPANCNRTTDSDCPVVCGNTVLEPGEACDKGITAGKAGACRLVCDDDNACTIDSVSGSVDDCTRTCSYAQVTACAAGDKCCPSGCTSDNDLDCASKCGNTVIENGETCDPPATCPTTCPDDLDTCTRETLVGGPTTCNADCRHIPVTSCSGTTSDSCCPTGCFGSVDADGTKYDVDCPPVA